MHQLFRLVLGQRDLSRAGDLFSLDDAEIEDSLSEALEEIEAIASSPDYLSNDNDQAVVEICIARVTTAIRETRSMERHGAALVSLWESCLEHSLRAEGKDEDAPHAKIASDITSCLLQNYDEPPVMALAVPVAVKFLRGGDRELSRNMSSYLSLAAIGKAELLAEHTDAIARAVLAGNHMLLRVLPSVYGTQPGVVHRHIQHLTALLCQVEQAEEQHLLRLLQMVAKEDPLMLSSSVPLLVEHLDDPRFNHTLLAVLVGVSQASPASLSAHLPALRAVGRRFPALLGPIAQVHGAVALADEALARSSLTSLMCLLSSSERGVHHGLLQEVRTLAERFSCISGAGDVNRTGNSFTGLGRLPGRHLDTGPASRDSEKLLSCSQEFSQQLVSFFALGTLNYTGARVREEAPQCRSRPRSAAVSLVLGGVSVGPVVFGRDPAPPVSRSRSLVLPVRSEEGSVEHSTEGRPAEGCAGAPPPHGEDDSGRGDWLRLHLRNNEERIRAFAEEMRRHVPPPERCVIEGTVRSVATLSFSCPLKGTYCLYAKSSFSLSSTQPRLWLQAMLLFCQSKATEPLCSEDPAVRPLRAMWEQTEPKGELSFEEAVTPPTFPHAKDVESLRQHLKEVRFFDLFGYSEEARDWLCFMCNNPEKATVVNQDGQPLIEGQLKEKQVRWRVIKRWKTRYFTLAGNQLLFCRGKSKEGAEDSPIELSKVQSVKAVARKRRDCGLPRAFEIFTESRSYVLKAQDEQRAQEWLQCINVAVAQAQARERQQQEATTYL
uniref:Ventricular zone expressed PH domain-containing 1 n=1 Tax=Scleropages formosus TaxID=113540 RepID=A0A8C9U7C6_SCLFO